MGFIDRAKDKFADKFGDEVVRKGSFGLAGEDEQHEEPVPKASKPPREKKSRPTRIPRAAKAKPVREPRNEPAPQPKPRPTPQVQQPEEEEFFSEQDTFEFPGETTEQVLDREALSTLAKDQGQTVEEILKSMNIQETFTIDDSILFLDEELANQSFETQSPYGYDMGEVDYFLNKSQRSVAEYVRLLRIRNDDIVKLASRISDLMVEVNNLRFNSEMANGINIMAGSGDDDALAVELDEARLRIRKLLSEIAALQAGGNIEFQEDSNELSKVRNELAAERLARQKAEGELQDLRAHMVDIEEEYDIEVFTERGELQKASRTETGYDAYSERRNEEFKRVDGWDDKPERELYAEEANFKSVGRDHWLPNSEEEAVLPEFEEEEVALDEVEFEEEGLVDINLDSYDESKGGGFSQDDAFGNSAFASDPYQNLDEFIEQNQEAFPDDNKSSAPTYEEDDDPDEDGFTYSFERNI